MSPSRVWSRSRKRSVSAVLDQLDAVEDAAADIARALEGVGALAGDQDRLLPGSQARGQPLVAGVAEQAAADGRHADERGVEVDEGLVGGRRVRPRCGSTAGASLSHSAVDVGDGQPEPGDRTLGDKRSPVGRGGHRRVDGRLCVDLGRSRRVNAESAPFAGQSRGHCRRSP